MPASPREQHEGPLPLAGPLPAARAAACSSRSRPTSGVSAAGGERPLEAERRPCARAARGTASTRRAPDRPSKVRAPSGSVSKAPRTSVRVASLSTTVPGAACRASHEAMRGASPWSVGVRPRSSGRMSSNTTRSVWMPTCTASEPGAGGAVAGAAPAAGRRPAPAPRAPPAPSRPRAPRGSRSTRAPRRPCTVVMEPPCRWMSSAQPWWKAASSSPKSSGSSCSARPASPASRQDTSVTCRRWGVTGRGLLAPGPEPLLQRAQPLAELGGRLEAARAGSLASAVATSDSSSPGSSGRRSRTEGTGSAESTRARSSSRRGARVGQLAR